MLHKSTVCYNFCCMYTRCYYHNSSASAQIGLASPGGLSLSHITHLQNPHIQKFPQSRSSARSSHIPPPSNHNSLAIHITKQRTRHRQNHTRCLSCGSGSPQRNIGMRIRPCRFLLRRGYAQCDLVPIWRRHKGTFFLCGG